MFKFLLYKFGQFMVRRLSLRTAYRIAAFLSDLQYYLSPRDRRAVRNNLRIIAGDTGNLKMMTRDVFRNFGRYLVEFFRMSGEIDKDFIARNVRIQNLSALEGALKKGKGAILLTAHIGNWELGGVIMGTLGYPSMAIALPHKERPVNDLFNRQRESQGVQVVPMQAAVRKCLETLRNNKIVALLADRDFSNHGEVLQFFGRPTLIPKGAALFSIKTGAPIIPAFLIREGEDRFCFHIGDAILPPEENDGHIATETLLSVMRKYVVVIEDIIRAYPSQWLMFRKFWLDV